ncbi:di-trans,poly-cis-decaprenylcistransferase [Candidatus Parcubacteria bacterium]|nr:di-trans,poly-cis-decaprenylcistransferase [Candidatus Parcubacteria bacterium]
MDVVKKNFPKHIGIVMDGNRRFARGKGWPVYRGHEAGYEKLKEFVRWAKESGVRTVYAYAFSTENWKRTKEEVSYLISLFERAIIKEADELTREGIRVKFIGQLGEFSPKLQAAMRKLEKETKDNSPTLVLAVSYGGRAELVAAAERARKEKGPLTEEKLAKHLSTAGLPDPELIIRTSGEIRTSNFLPWQAAYSEWYFTKTLWPALTKKEFLDILGDFSKRERRNGK